jgi:hypothetical protein
MVRGKSVDSNLMVSMNVFFVLDARLVVQVIGGIMMGEVRVIQ